MTEPELRAELCRIGKSLFDRGYAHSTAGNLSARLDDGFLITPTDACLGFLEADRIAKVDLQGRHAGGDRPSKTLALHRLIYETDASAGCVIHTHSTHLVALTLNGVWRADDILPPLTPYQLMKVGHVPLVPYHVPGDPAVAEHVARLIASQRPGRLHAVMVERLGPNVWHRTPAQAMAALEELEETAKLWLLSQRQAAPLSDEAIAALRAAFDTPW